MKTVLALLAVGFVVFCLLTWSHGSDSSDTSTNPCIGQSSAPCNVGPATDPLRREDPKIDLRGRP